MDLHKTALYTSPFLVSGGCALTLCGDILPVLEQLWSKGRTAFANFTVKFWPTCVLIDIANYVVHRMQQSGELAYELHSAVIKHTIRKKTCESC